VKSYYQVLSTFVRSTFPWKIIWKVKVPLRVASFVWTKTLGKILTLDNLRKMNIIVEWCCKCKTCRESIDYLFLQCEVAIKMWSALLPPFGVAWVMLRRVRKLLGSWKGQLGNRIALRL
jgi:hypothetical protein